MSALADVSPLAKARIAGFFWLTTFVTGMTAMLIGGRLVVRGDAAATAASILAHEAQYRSAIAINLVAGACYLAATVFVYDLLKPVSRNVSLLAALFSLAGCVVGASSSVLQLAPLAVLRPTQTLAELTGGQLQALAYAFLRVDASATAVSFLFFGLHCLLVGGLITRSTFLPRVVGVLMVFAGLGWLTGAFASLLSPPLASRLGAFPMLPGLVGELTLSLWLLFVGVKVERWREQAKASAAQPIGEAIRGLS